MSEDDNELPKLLIVDDSRMVRASIIKHIRGRFAFREESDGESAWQALVVDPSIQLVLSDIGMPQLDGYGLLSRIRASKVSRIHDIPVVIISGDEEAAVRERARQLGANDFISKGIGATELLARLDSLTRLAQTRRELEESRSALAQQSPVDPGSGLASPAYLNHHGAQELAHARRHQGDISTLVIEVDHYDQLAEWHGANVAQLIVRKLSKILANKVRKEDTVAQLAPARFVVLSPSTDVVGCCAFALRMQKAIEKLVMTYRDERIRVTVTAGVASSSVDGMKTVSHLIGAAIQRVRAGIAAGGNRVMADKGEVTPEMVERQLRQMLSLDHALMQLRLGTGEELGERLPDIVSTLLPLLDLVESRLHCGIPLDVLKQYALSRGGSGGSEGAKTPA